MYYAPIALFTYSRADHTRQAVESLLQNAEAKDSDLYIFSDGPKTEEKRVAVEENRKYIHSIKEINDNAGDNEKSFRSVTIVEREKNWGLADSLIAGITEIVNKYGRVIVVEDDLVVSPYFLKFMNDGLEKYKDEDKVGAIAAYIPEIHQELPDTFFLKFFQCWGWATWKRSWDILNTDTKYLLRKLRFKVRDFDMYTGAYGNLYCHKVGLVNSWYVRYYASLYLAKKITLFPGHSLVSNIGLDGSGTHCKETSKESPIIGKVWNKEIPYLDIPIEENSMTRRLFVSFYKNLSTKNKNIKYYYNSFKSFIRRLLYIDCL